MDAVPCSSGYRAVPGTLQFQVPCSSRYRAVLDTESPGLPHSVSSERPPGSPERRESAMSRG